MHRTESEGGVIGRVRMQIAGTSTLHIKDVLSSLLAHAHPIRTRVDSLSIFLDPYFKMSSSTVLSIGDRCSAPDCNLIDFLPILCPTCSHPFCSSHIHSNLHSCFKSNGKSAVLEKFEAQARCPVLGCERRTLESAGRTEGYDEGRREYLGKEIKCEGCGIAFCAS